MFKSCSVGRCVNHTHAHTESSMSFWNYVWMSLLQPYNGPHSQQRQIDSFSIFECIFSNVSSVHWRIDVAAEWKRPKQHKQPACEPEFFDKQTPLNRGHYPFGENNVNFRLFSWTWRSTRNTIHITFVCHSLWCEAGSPLDWSLLWIVIKGRMMQPAWAHITCSYLMASCS